MTRTVWNLSDNNPASEGVRCAGAFALLTLVVLGLAGGLPAADEPFGPFLFTSSNKTWNDIETEAKVRRALREDDQLRPLNLCVHMSGGVAALAGPVPTPELKQRAITLVGRLDGVLLVNSKELYISTSEQSGKRLVVVIQEDRPVQTRSASVGGEWRVEGGGNNAPAGGSQQITLLAPEMAAPAAQKPPASKLAEGKAGGTRLTANPHPVSPAVSIGIALEQLRRRERGYQQIRARVQGTTVFVYPGDATSEDTMSFAQAVRRITGVQHVILSSDPR